MEFDKKKSEGKIFPELGHETPKFSLDEPELGGEFDQHKRLRREDREPIVNPRRQPVSHVERPSVGSLWMALVFLLLALAGVSFYGYRTLQAGNIQLSQIPEMQNSMTAVKGRVDAVEENLQSLASNWRSLSEQIAQVEKAAKSNYQSARQYSKTLNTVLEQRIEDRLDGRDYIVDSRLDKLDAAQEADLVQINQLRKDLTDARQEIVALRQETNSDLALLHRQASGNDEQLGAIARRLEPERVNFEVSKNQVTSIVPDISVNLMATDVAYQRFTGWVYYLPDRRFLWVHDHGVQQPVVFYGRDNSQQYQVVITSVQNASAAGYLLLPGESNSASRTIAGTAGGK
jgi:hypothetical protein